MSSMNLHLTILTAVLLYLPVATAQDGAATGVDAAPTAGSIEEPTPTNGEEPLTAPPPEPGTATGPSPDTFKPSEEISEDLSVSFPVDI